jgi:hypothetical protein
MFNLADYFVQRFAMSLVLLILLWTQSLFLRCSQISKNSVHNFTMSDVVQQDWPVRVISLISLFHRCWFWSRFCWVTKRPWNSWRQPISFSCWISWWKWGGHVTSSRCLSSSQCMIPSVRIVVSISLEFIHAHHFWTEPLKCCRHLAFLVSWLELSAFGCVGSKGLGLLFPSEYAIIWRPA